MNIHDFPARKKSGEKISVITCYDFPFAKIIDQTSLDVVLVGDTLAMVVHGHETTLTATLDMMVLHTKAVAKGTKKFLVTDLPFLSYRKGLVKAMDAVEKIMQAGAHAIKLEGCLGNEKLIRHIVDSGVPVMGHLGLTPQSFYQLGGYQVQGKEKTAAKILREHAEILANAGCFALVLECIPSEIAKEITQKIAIPTIGIGAGALVDGQVLVLHDLLGFNTEFKPKFLKHYFSGFAAIKNALDLYDHEVKKSIYPSKEFSYDHSY